MDTDQVNKVLALLRDMRALLALSLGDKLEVLAEEALQGDPDRQAAYEALADGGSYREIADEVGKAPSTIGNWVGDWKELGLVDPVTHDCRVPPSLLTRNST